MLQEEPGPVDTLGSVQWQPSQTSDFVSRRRTCPVGATESVVTYCSGGSRKLTQLAMEVLGPHSIYWSPSRHVAASLPILDKRYQPIVQVSPQRLRTVKPGLRAKPWPGAGLRGRPPGPTRFADQARGTGVPHSKTGTDVETVCLETFYSNPCLFYTSGM